MKTYVLNDASLERQAGQFVWLEIDFENPENAEVLAKFPIAALPTYLIVDPADEQPVLRWVGGASIEQLHAILDEGKEAVGRAMLARENGEAPESGAGEPLIEAERELTRADLLYGQARYAEAVPHYEAALDIAPDPWPSRARAIESLLFAYDRSEQPEPAARLAVESYAQHAGTAPAGNIAASGLGAAVDLPEDHPSRGEWIEVLEGHVRDVLRNPPAGLAADELSGVYIALYNAREAAGDDEGRMAVAREWSDHLDRAAAAAANAEQRMVYDSHRLSAYLELGEPERALPMLEQSLIDAPDDYNPEARLAVVYRELGRWDEAIRASEQALDKSYGPRKLRIYYNFANIYAASGDTASARAIAEAGLQHAQSLPEPQRSKTWIQRLEGRRDLFR